MRILIAEDDPISRRLLEVTLRKWGYEVEMVADGTRAWEVLQRPDAPPLAILDWMMPGLDGVDLCRRVRGQERDAYTYLVLLTARGQKSDIAAALDAGADDYLIKPFDAQELRARLRAGERIVDLQARLLRALESMGQQARRDALTQLWNHSEIRDLLRRALSSAPPPETTVAVILADIDHFKQVNDTYGHPAGDAALREVAARLQSALRCGDHLGRYGGEEFMAVLPGCDAASGERVGERLREAVSRDPVMVEGQPVTLTISLGLATGSGATPGALDALIRDADAALYRAKHGGRDRLELSVPQT